MAEGAAGIAAAVVEEAPAPPLPPRPRPRSPGEGWSCTVQYNLLPLGPLPYAPVLAQQARLVEARVRDGGVGDALVLVEHAPVYSLEWASNVGPLSSWMLRW